MSLPASLPPWIVFDNTSFSEHTTFRTFFVSFASLHLPQNILRSTYLHILNQVFTHSTMAPPKPDSDPHAFHSRSGFRGGRGRGQGSAKPACRNYQQTGQCPFDKRCTFSHGAIPASGHKESSGKPLEQSERTPEQQQIKADCQSWKKLIKLPPKANDTAIMTSIWT